MKIKTHVNPNYKTKKCIQFHEKGYCPYGSRCQFMHKEMSDLSLRDRFMSLHSIDRERKNSNENFSYANIIKEIASKMTSEIEDLSSNKVPVKKRLKTFENLVGDGERPDSNARNSSILSNTHSNENSKDYKEIQDEIFKYTINHEIDDLAAYDLDQDQKDKEQKTLYAEDLWTQLGRSRFFSA